MIFEREDKITKSDLLTVIVEPDTEAPDDKNAWVLVLACQGAGVPVHFGGGYLHPPGCACEKDETLCDVGWLQEFVTCAGTEALISGNEVLVEKAAFPGGVVISYGDSSPLAPRLRLTGRMVSEKFEGMEGTDYDERFEVESARIPRCTCDDIGEGSCPEHANRQERTP